MSKYEGEAWRQMTLPAIPNLELEAEANRLEKMVVKTDNWILRYYQKIEDGSVTVGRWIRLLYERIIADLEAKAYYFDQARNGVFVRQAVICDSLGLI